ncbi:unnamed protein product [Cunninghamella blakesleeana]
MVSILITELSVLISELLELIKLPLKQSQQVFPLAESILVKTNQFSPFYKTNDEEQHTLETIGVSLWNGITRSLHEKSTENEKLRATLYHISYKLLKEAYKLVVHDNIDLLLNSLEISIFVASESIKCQQYSSAEELVQDAEQWVLHINNSVSENDQQLPYQMDYFIHYQLDLLMIKSELAAKLHQWKEVQAFVKKIYENINYDSILSTENVNLLFRFCFNVAHSLISNKKLDDALHWIITFYTSLRKYDYYNDDFMIYMVKLIGYILLQQDDTTTLDEFQTQNLMEIVSSYPQTSENGFDYYATKLAILYQSTSVDNKTLENTFFQMVENIDPLNRNVLFDMKDIYRFQALVLKLDNKLNFDSLTGGLDLFMNRCIKYQSEKDDNNSSNVIFKSLYLCKLYVISDWISKKLTTIKQIPNFNNSVMLIMKEMYLFKDRLSDIDIKCSQMILWKTGDIFFENDYFSNALLWYKQIWDLSIVDNICNEHSLNLARKITACNIQTKNVDHNSSKYINTVIENMKLTSTVEDYLLLLEISILQNELKLANDYLDKLFDDKKFTIDMIVSSMYICYKNGAGTLMQRIMNFGFYLFKEHKKDIYFQNNIMMMLRWIIRYYVNGKLGSNASSGLLLNKDQIISNIEKGVLFFNWLKESQFDVLQRDFEWMYRTAWNLGLQFYRNNYEVAGETLFNITNKLLKLIIGNERLNYQQTVCSIICMSAKIFSTTFNKLPASEKTLACNDVLSLLAKLDETQLNTHNSDAWCALLPILQVYCYTTLQRFDDAYNVLKTYDQQCGESTSLDGIAIYEYLAEIILKNDHTPVLKSLQILRMVALRIQNYSHLEGMYEKWATWNRIYISTSMSSQQKEYIYDYIEHLLNSISKHPYPQKEIHYLVVIAWNEGLTRFHAYDQEQAKQWCLLAKRLVNYLDQSYTPIKNQITQALSTLGLFTET